MVAPFAAYLIASGPRSSGVIAVVVAGILLGHKAPIIQNARSRITETITWRTIAFLLENAVFLLIGLQTRSILAAIAESDLSIGHVVMVCLAVLACVIVVRVAFVFAQQGIHDAFRPPSERTPRSNSFVIGWAGMRGVVTLAAALLIPSTVPHHEVLLLIALTVVVGTLFGQGLALPLITRALKVDAPESGKRCARQGHRPAAGGRRGPPPIGRPRLRRPDRRRRPDPYPPRPAHLRGLGAAVDNLRHRVAV